MDLLVILCKLNVAVGVCNSYTIIYYTILYYTILYYTILYYTILLKFFNHLICVLPVLLHTRDIASHECSFLSWIPLRVAETCRRFTTYLYIIVSIISQLLVYIYIYIYSRKKTTFMASYMWYYYWYIYTYIYIHTNNCNIIDTLL